MSWVNNALVVYGMESGQRMAEVNAYLLTHDHRQQQFRTDESPMPWYGGNKFMEGRVWGAAFNYVDYYTVMEALESTTWEHPEQVLLIWKGEEDYYWDVYRLGDDVKCQSRYQ